MNLLEAFEAIVKELHIDFGFGRIPTLTVEDVILAKLCAIQSKVRPKDLDDLDSIFTAKPAMDWSYLKREAERMQLRLPSSAKPFLPDVLRRLLRINKHTERFQKEPD
ncbi:MAG: nucleotidyl transferase AbiEii/AbiGii toxin family protein [Kiritimatiellia bacterium]